MQAHAGSWSPVHFLYLNFHDAIRSELEDVQNDARSLLAPDQQVHEKLIGLRDRVRFLEQVHSYHSSVEDEVGFPLLFFSSMLFMDEFQPGSDIPFCAIADRMCNRL